VQSASADPVELEAWTSGLVYGTLTVLVVVAGIEAAGGAQPAGAGAVILVGASATWLAHAYAKVLGSAAATGREVSAGQIGPALLHASTIVLAAIPAMIAFGGASLGWWSSEAALSFSNGAGIAILAGAGWLAARAAGAGGVGRITSTILTAAIGLAIVAVELLLLH
jgi:hypothetical protein